MIEIEHRIFLPRCDKISIVSRARSSGERNAVQKISGPVAQWLEHCPDKTGVGGSIPPGPTIKNSANAGFFVAEKK